MALVSLYSILVLLLFSAIPANAEWKYSVKEDEFDNKKSKMIFSLSNASDALAITDNHSGSVDPANPKIILKLGNFYICSLTEGGLILVDWIVLNDQNSIIARDSQTVWENSRTHDALFIRSLFKADEAVTEGAKLLSAMIAGNEVRFRFTDDCGNQSDSKFSLDGFASTYSKLKTANP